MRRVMVVGTKKRNQSEALSKPQNDIIYHVIFFFTLQMCHVQKFSQLMKEIILMYKYWLKYEQ